MAAAMLVGCSGSRPPIGAPGAIPQSRASSDGYTSLYSFGATPDGQQPKAGLINVNGTLYGTTYTGGKYGDGTVFTISTSGAEQVLHSFQPYTGDGLNPSAALLSMNGTLYGTTKYGGIPSSGGCNAGTVFSVSTTGTEKVVYPFYGYYCHDHVYSDGANPVASLINVKGKLYGTTESGGSAEFFGTVFRVTTSGKEKVLHSFGEDYFEGGVPAGRLLDVRGTLYGTTLYGGQTSAIGQGVFFSIDAAGSEKVLLKFYGENGAYPADGLIKASGYLYGTTGAGGSNGGSFGGGTAFRVKANGDLTTLHNFGYGSDGAGPISPLLDVHSIFYGVTAYGGAYGKGTVFRMSLHGKEKVLHSFGYGSDGAAPLAGLINVNGTLYGTTSAGGSYGNGTVFALTLPSGS